VIHSGIDRAKIPKVTLDAFKARQSLVKGERLVRHEEKAVLLYKATSTSAHIAVYKSMWEQNDPNKTVLERSTCQHSLDPQTHQPRRT